jgi:hypothetical protein
VTHDVPLSDPTDDRRASVVPEDAQSPEDSLVADDLAVATAADAEGLARARESLRLLELVREIEQHVASVGWDQAPRMFALARTVELVALEPALAAALGAAGEDPDSVTPIEQEPLDGERGIEEVLATTMWPDEVVGAALVLERLMLPPGAEESLPDDGQAALDAAVSAHPDRQDVRIAVVVTRDGRRMCALRLRSHDADGDVLVGPDLVPRLADALAATFS